VLYDSKVHGAHFVDIFLALVSLVVVVVVVIVTIDRSLHRKLFV